MYPWPELNTLIHVVTKYSTDNIPPYFLNAAAGSSSMTGSSLIFELKAFNRLSAKIALIKIQLK